MATDGAVSWGDVSVWVNVACPSAAHRRALWIASTEGALPMPHKPRAGSYESVALEAHPPTPPTGTYVDGALARVPTPTIIWIHTLPHWSLAALHRKG